MSPSCTASDSRRRSSATCDSALMARLRRDGDVLLLILGADEVEVLASLAEGLAARVGDASHGGPGDAIIERLTPTASRGDDALDAELRAMLRGDLLSGREARLSAFADELRSARASATGDAEVTFDRETAMRAVEALNDVRLALATTVGLDLAPIRDVGPDDPRQEALLLIDALAWLQGGLIEYVDVDGPEEADHDR